MAPSANWRPTAKPVMNGSTDRTVPLALRKETTRSPPTLWVRPGVTYDPDSDDAGGDWCNRLFAPPASFLTTGNLSTLAIDEPAPALGDGDHCRTVKSQTQRRAGVPAHLGKLLVMPVPARIVLLAAPSERSEALDPAKL